MNTTFTVTAPDGRTVHGEISPCAWMYPGYGMQVRLALKLHACNAESEFLRWKTPYKQSSDSDVLAHVHAFLAKDGLKNLEAALVRWAQAQAEFAEQDRKLAAADARRVASRKAKGYTHRMLAWVHPRAGSDFQIEAWFKSEPTRPEVVAILRKQGSVLFDDFKVETL